MRFTLKLLALSASLLASVPAMAGVAVIVSPGASVSPDKAQVANLFLGKDKSMEAVDSASWDATKEAFYAEVVGRNEGQIKAYWSSLLFTGKGKPLPTVKSDSEMIAKVSGSANAIGYVSSESVTDGVKVLFTLP